MALSAMELDRESAHWFALNSVAGMDTALFNRLLDSFGSARAAWEAPAEAVDASGAFSPAMRSNFDEARKRFNPDDLAPLGVANILWTKNHPEYPERLKTISDAPPVLYGKGDWKPCDATSVAIVGTRKCTGYGRDIARRLAAELAAAGVTIVSGLATGIDTAAHQGALQAGGRTIAVLGSGLNFIYPASNARLAEEISESGLILSEFDPAVSPERWTFPRRNRIISGMTLGTIVVEADETSGAMITAENALKQGRAVFAVPGDINRSGARGPHRLLRRGAYLVETADDVLGALRLSAGEQRELPLETALEGREKDVYAALGDPISFNEICVALGATAAETAAVLMMLEMKGLVSQLPGKIFVRKR